jgi:hypothetical protein
MYCEDEQRYQSTAPVLVCIAQSQADLERAANQGWYRIPVARAPKRLACDYLAFYQTAAFGQGRWSIRWLAPVQSVRVASRAELLPEEGQHPRARQLYYRFSLGALKELPVPLPSRRLRRISFIATTLGLLLQARDVTELWGAPADIQADVWGAGIGRKGVLRRA